MRIFTLAAHAPTHPLARPLAHSTPLPLAHSTPRPLAHSPTRIALPCWRRTRPLAALTRLLYHSPARSITRPRPSLSERLFPRDMEDGEEGKGAAGGLDPPTADVRPKSPQEENPEVPAATSPSPPAASGKASGKGAAEA